MKSKTSILLILLLVANGMLYVQKHDRIHQEEHYRFCDCNQKVGFQIQVMEQVR